ncbi:MAG: YmdB family metallophosphoesterase, partial [Clostridia bacterium]|nr:YmdB family metallophosphoesterase [Clostridia bacterium]
GMTAASAEALLFAGADVVTGGNHTARRAEILSYLEDSDRVLRPANLPGDFPGSGIARVDADGARVLVVNLIGQTYMDPANSRSRRFRVFLSASAANMISPPSTFTPRRRVKNTRWPECSTGKFPWLRARTHTCRPPTVRCFPAGPDISRISG